MTQDLSMPTPKIHYGWIVVGITCLVLLTSAGIRSTPGILMVPLEEEFHWSLANIAAAYGWPTTVLSIAAVVCVVLPLVALILRDRPSDVGLMPYGETGEPKPAVAPKGNPIMLAFAALRDAVHYRDFWLLAGTYFVCGASTNGLIGTHLIPACVDHGLTEVVGASLLAGTGAFAFIGGFASGWLSDRFDNRFLLFWYYGLRGRSLLYLPFPLAMSFYGLPLFSVFFGPAWIAGVPPTVRLLSRAVGVERTGIMVAWITVIHQVGGAAVAYLAGVARITSGSYLEAF